MQVLYNQAVCKPLSLACSEKQWDHMVAAEAYRGGMYGGFFNSLQTYKKKTINILEEAAKNAESNSS